MLRLLCEGNEKLEKEKNASTNVPTEPLFCRHDHPDLCVCSLFRTGVSLPTPEKGSHSHNVVHMSLLFIDGK